MEKVVGVYTTVAPAGQKSQALDWKSIEMLQDKIGLNLIILGCPEAAHLAEIVPKAKSNPEKLMNDKALQVSAEATETMKLVIKEAHSRNIKVWFVFGGFAEMWKDEEMMNRDIYGNIVKPSTPEVWEAYSWCPNKPYYRELLKLLATYSSKKYDVDGWTFTHMRFSPIGLSPWHFFSCACKDCARKANQLGYDFDKMISGLNTFIENLKSLSSNDVSNWIDARPSFFDILQFIGNSDQVVNWINFRSESIFSMFEELYSSIKSVRSDIKVGQDIFPPSFSLLSGHRYKEFSKKADFLSPLLSHPMLFTMLGFAELTKLIRSWNSNIKESELLILLHHVFGYSHLNLPTSISQYATPLPMPSSDYEHPYIDLAKVVATEVRKAKLLVGGSTQVYPVVAAHRQISAQGAYNRTKSVIVDALSEGIIFQFGELPGPPKNIEAISRILK